MRKTYYLGLMPLMILLMAGIVYGAFGISQPAANEYVKGTYLINGTAWAGDGVGGNCTNVTADYRISGGSSYTYIGANKTSNNITGNWGVSGWDTRLLNDDTIYSLRARCINNTNAAVISTATEVQFYVDNSVPVFGTPTPADASTGNARSNTISIACYNTSSATITIGGNLLNMAESSDVCTLTQYFNVGTLSYSITASDGLNTTTSDTYTVGISESGGVSPAQLQQLNQQQPITTTTAASAKPSFVDFIRAILSLPFKILNAIFGK